MLLPFDPAGTRSFGHYFIVVKHCHAVFWLDLPAKNICSSFDNLLVRGGWLVSVGYPVIAPELVSYQVLIENVDNGFRWEGELDADFQLVIK